MMPDMVFSDKKEPSWDALLWDSFVSPYAPDDVATSGITQPPMLAEAVYRVGQKLPLAERRSWFKQMLPAIISFHEWLYRERDPKDEGLVTLVHPYECGLDDSPPWLDELHQRGIPRWIKLIGPLDFIVNRIRRDTRNTRPGQRMSNIEALSFFVALRRLRRKAYESDKILNRPYLAVQDLLYNSILVRANQRLAEIAKVAGVALPAGLVKNAQLAEKALESLWDEESEQYFCKSYTAGHLIKQPSIMTFLPLYSGAISKERAERLVSLLKSRHYDLAWPVPSAPKNSGYFNADKYWQGPTWVNTNWLIIDGLRHYGYAKEADELAARTIKLVAKSGFSEYYNPLNASGNGADNFSWSAALTIDLLQN
jgi:hypothetical protein